MGFDDKIKAELARIEQGGAPKYHQKNAETGKLFARERVRLLVDPGPSSRTARSRTPTTRSCRPTVW